MRRPRHKLQVSTFPFLAVLLAAMGSLILLLLVMDRRAKIVARNKASEELAAKNKARENLSSEVEDQRRRDWEQQAAQLHAAILAQVADLTKRQAGVCSQADQSVAQLRFEEEQMTELEDKLEQEKAALVKDHEGLKARQGAQANLAQQHDAKNLELLAERAKLAGQLAQLETAWRQLQLLKGREQNTYSLVAYQGKRGENRRPIYVECRGDGVVFHPEGKTLGGHALTDMRFREEVQSQGAALEKAKTHEAGKHRPAPAPPSTGPYVLFLVRPEGIDTYYEAAAALRGYQIDFGYEFIERDWRLDLQAHGRRSVGYVKSGAGDSGPWTGFGTGNGKPGLRGGEPVVHTGKPGHPWASSSPNATDMGFSGSGPETQYTLPDWRPALRPWDQRKGAYASHSGGSKNDAGGGNHVARFKDAPASASGENPKGSGANQGPIKEPQASMDAPDPGKKTSEIGGSEGSARGEPPDPLSRPPLPGQKPPANMKPAPSLGRLTGNRDFVVTIECYAETAAVYPGGQVFDLTGAAAPTNAEALKLYVQQLIARRQAGVRPGEAAYRPALRFSVQPEGLRTYYRVCAPLEGLRLPMSRENVEE